MWPDAPNMSHTACLAGLEGDGGSVLDGSWTLGKDDVEDDEVGRIVTSSITEMFRWDMSVGNRHCLLVAKGSRVCCTL